MAERPRDKRWVLINQPYLMNPLIVIYSLQASVLWWREKWLKRERAQSEDERILVQQKRHFIKKRRSPSNNCEILAWVSWEICQDMILNAIKIRTAGQETVTLSVWPATRAKEALTLSTYPHLSLSFFPPPPAICHPASLWPRRTLRFAPFCFCRSRRLTENMWHHASVPGYFFSH